jgi:hypothetical protein
LKWDAVTSGEELFLFIRNDVLPSLPSSRAVWANLREVLNAVGGSPGFNEYFLGAVAIQATRRLVRHCSEETDGAIAAMHVKIVSKFASEDVFPSLDRDLIGRLARLVVQATKASDQNITRTTRTLVLRGMEEVQCYLCGRLLDPAVPDGNPAFLSLDHLWPASIGGESDEDNLLPACCDCQQKKADSPSWEWINLHNMVWPSAPSADATRKIERQTRIARYYHQVTGVAAERRCSLKKVFLELGKMMSPATFARTGVPTTFFDLQTVEP